MGSSTHFRNCNFDNPLSFSGCHDDQETHSLRHRMAIKKKTKPKTQTLVFTQVIDAICNLIVVTVMLIGIITLYDIASYIINIKK